MSVLNSPKNDMCYCPGCSHGMVLESLARAVDRLGRPNEAVCLVSDIGCIGTADRYFNCHTFHGLHGRSITYAEGIKRARPDTTVVVLIGDGGCGIGTAHLVHAARRNADITVIVCNNFNFGMTGGQHSPTTPWDAHTTTTPGGAGDYPFDICGTVAVNGAAHVARHHAFDEHLVDDLEAALRTPGFSLVDVWELCTAYFVPANKLSRGSLDQLSGSTGLPMGRLPTTARRPPVVTGEGSHAVPRTKPGERDSSPASSSQKLNWPRRRELVVAGAAGQRVRSAVGAIGEIAVVGGVFAAQQDDFPITVRKGFSLSSLVVAGSPILYCGTDRPDTVIVLSPEGAARMGDLSALDPACHVLIDEKVSLSGTRARVTKLSMHDLERRAGKASAALAAVASAMIVSEWFTPEALRAAADSAIRGPYREESLAAIEAGISWQLEQPAASR